MIGKVKFNVASREIRIGYEDIENVGQMNIEKVFTDIENQGKVDNFMMIYLKMKQISTLNPNPENPDVHISVLSPKQSTGLIDSRLWFTKDGAVIGIRSGVSWDQVDYFEINKDDAQYIKEQIGWLTG